jgi:hypothetical protein
MLIFLREPSITVLGFRQREDGGISPPPQKIQGGISPLNLSFFRSLFSGFENLITSMCNFKAFRSRINDSKVLKSHHGAISKKGGI